jgi:excinuclease ABC subunit B
MQFNLEHGIEPQTIRKAISDIMQYVEEAAGSNETSIDSLADELAGLDRKEVMRIISSLEDEMAIAAAGMDFENAARLRDQVVQLRVRIEGTEEKDVLEALKRASRKSAPGPARRKRRTTKA